MSKSGGWEFLKGLHPPTTHPTPSPTGSKPWIPWPQRDFIQLPCHVPWERWNGSQRRLPSFTRYRVHRSGGGQAREGEAGPKLLSSLTLPCATTQQKDWTWHVPILLLGPQVLVQDRVWVLQRAWIQAWDQPSSLKKKVPKQFSLGMGSIWAQSSQDTKRNLKWNEL